MSIRKLCNLIVIASILISIPMASSSVKPVSAQTSIFADFASFEAATGELIEIDLELGPSYS